MKLIKRKLAEQRLTEKNLAKQKLVEEEKELKAQKRKRKEFAITLIAAFCGALIPAVVAYYVTYQKIEKPKIAIEALKQVQFLSPKIAAKCGAERTSYNLRTWRVTCNVKNDGIYPVYVDMLDSASVVRNDKTEDAALIESDSFTFIPTSKDTIVQLLPQSSGSFRGTVVFNEEKFPCGFHDNAIKIVIEIKYSSIDSIKNFFLDKFDDLKDIINANSDSSVSYYFGLPSNEKEGVVVGSCLQYNALKKKVN